LECVKPVPKVASFECFVLVDDMEGDADRRERVGREGSTQASKFRLCRRHLLLASKRSTALALCTAPRKGIAQRQSNEDGENERGISNHVEGFDCAEAQKPLQDTFYSEHRDNELPPE